jgi:hypothetical protein
LRPVETMSALPGGAQMSAKGQRTFAKWLCEEKEKPRCGGLMSLLSHDTMFF